jgi:MFS family permease
LVVERAPSFPADSGTQRGGSAQLTDRAARQAGTDRRKISERTQTTERSGPDPKTFAFRTAIAESGFYPLAVLVTLNLVDEIDQAVLAVFAPNIREYFGLDRTRLGLIVGVQVSLLVVAAVPLGYVATRVNRARMLRRCAAIWSFFSCLTAAATNLAMFLVARIGSGTGKAAVDPVGKSLLADSYPPQVWNRVFALHNAANPLGNIVGPLMAGAVAVAAGRSPTAWRWAFPILTIPTLITLIASRRLSEPSVAVAKTFMGASMTATGAPPGLGFITAVRRIIAIPTFRRQLVGVGVLGFALIGVAAFASLLYEEVFGIDEPGRGLIFSILATASLAGNLLGGPFGDHIFQRSPRLAVRVVGTGIAANTIILAAGVFLPTIHLVVGLQWLAILTLTTVIAPLNAVMSAICPSRLRSLMLSLITLCIALFGGVFGGALVGRIADLTGDVRWGLASLAPFGVVGGLLMASGASTVDADIARLAELDAYGEPLDKSLGK